MKDKPYGATDEQGSPRPQQEHFGEASLGEAQSSDPPADPEMLEDPDRTREPQDDVKDGLGEEPDRTGAKENVSQRQPGAESGR